VLSCNVAVVVTVKQSTGRQWQQAIFASGTSYAAAAAAGTDASLQGKHPIALFALQGVVILLPSCRCTALTGFEMTLTPAADSSSSAPYARYRTYKPISNSGEIIALTRAQST